MIVVIGAGLIGLATAYELARRGADVRVIDTGAPAGGASWAAAGMLAPYSEELSNAAFEGLCAEALAAYPGFVAELYERSTVDPHLRLDGVLHAVRDDAGAARLRARVAELAARGIEARFLDRAAALEREPALGHATQAAAFVAGEGQVDNRRLGRALLAGCAALGVTVVADAADVTIEVTARRVLGVRSRTGFVAAQAVVNAAGAYAGALPGVPPYARVPVFPVKGQMVALAAPSVLMRRVCWVPGAYLVPRPDGRLLVGATVERVGFDMRVTAAGVRALLAAALDAVPALRDLAISETWAGLRPGSPDGLPIVGATALEGYFVAAGHYRNGILLAPVTARIVADALEGKPARPDAAVFAPMRTFEEGPAVSAKAL